VENKSLKRIALITNNTLRQVLVSLFGMVIPFLVIHFSAKETWGSFVSVLLFSLLALQIINWGNKEYLLRKFSEKPAKIAVTFSENLTTRLPFLVLFSIVALFLFPFSFGFWITLWLIGRYWNYSTEALVLYQKEFNKSMVIETLSFIGFGISFYCLKAAIDVYSLLVIYSMYQFLKGLLYFLLFRKYFSLQYAVFKMGYFKASLSFFLLSVLGFLASKIDVYIIESVGDKTVTADYQIINSLLVFVMSVTAFIYSPFAKTIYRNKEDVVRKIQKALVFIGIFVVIISLVLIHLIIRFYLKTSVGIGFYVIAFLYVYPSYVYGLDIVNLFKQHNEKIVVRNLVIGVIVNTVLSLLFLSLLYGGFEQYGINAALLGSAIAQIVVLILFKLFKPA
jgi:O-antigen/teichoic acid export membrane protein